MLLCSISKWRGKVRIRAAYICSRLASVWNWKWVWHKGSLEASDIRSNRLIAPDPSQPKVNPSRHRQMPGCHCNLFGILLKICLSPIFTLGFFSLVGCMDVDELIVSQRCPGPGLTNTWRSLTLPSAAVQKWNSLLSFVSEPSRFSLPPHGDNILAVALPGRSQRNIGCQTPNGSHKQAMIGARKNIDQWGLSY